MIEIPAPGSGGRLREIRASAGERVRVLGRAFGSLPMDYRFSAKAAQPGRALAGTVIVRRFRWVVPSSPAPVPLLAENRVHAGFWDTFVSVDVVADTDVVIRVDERGLPHRASTLVFAACVLGIAAALMVLIRA